MNYNLNKILLFLSSLLFFSPTFAGTIIQSKNNRVLINLDGDSANADDQFYVINKENKKVAIVKIAIVKKQKAIADVIKGKVSVGQTTQPRSQQTMTSAHTASESPATKGSTFLRHDLIQIGLHFKYMMNSISAVETDSTPAPATNTETVDMTGSNFGVAATMDYPLYNWLRVQGQGSYEMLDVKGTGQYNSCDGKTSKDCNAKITYLGLQGILRYDITKTQLNFWLGLGGAIKIPISKKSTALNITDLVHSDSFTLVAGLDYHLNNKSYIPVSFEYHLSQNTSSEVPKIDQMNLLVGYGFKF
jgi:opacity protein-like surface antigen